MLNSNESRVEGGIFGAYGDPPPVIYPRNFVWARPDKHGDRSEALEIALLEEEKEEGVEITRYRRAVNVYRNIPPFSWWVLIFFASPPRSNETRKREREIHDAGWQIWIIKFGQRFTPERCTGEGGRTRNKTSECRAWAPCNQAQSRRLLIYTSSEPRWKRWEEEEEEDSSAKIVNTVRVRESGREREREFHEGHEILLRPIAFWTARYPIEVRRNVHDSLGVFPC